MSLHAIASWPQAVTTQVWSYTLAHTCNIANYIPQYKIGVFPIELFSKIDVKSKLKTFDTFDCPIYTLDFNLQNNRYVPKWHIQCRTGIYLDNLPMHTRSCSLVLHLETARVSPQFHVHYDEFFETVSKNKTQLS